MSRRSGGLLVSSACSHFRALEYLGSSYGKIRLDYTPCGNVLCEDAPNQTMLQSCKRRHSQPDMNEKQL